LIHTVPHDTHREPRRRHPGHGEPFKGKERIDMTAHKAHYPAITGPGVNPAAVSRIYEVLEKRAE
jgi:hypothetical protein